MVRPEFTNQLAKHMRNFTIVLLTILSGLSYGWCIIHYPITAQILAGGMGMSFLFVVMVALYKTHIKEK